MARIKCHEITADSTIGHGSMIYDVTSVMDYGDTIVIWYRTPTGPKRREFYPEDDCTRYTDPEVLTRDRALLLRKV